MYTPEETKVNREKWIAALRSGKYLQVQDSLKDDVGYCCLGVACEISGLGDWAENKIYRVGLRFSSIDLPGAVVEYYGLASQEGSWGLDETEDSLIERNDRGATFEEIANIIENPPKHFLVSDCKQE